MPCSIRKEAGSMYRKGDHMHGRADPPCPLCGGVGMSCLFFRTTPFMTFQLARCLDCGLVRTLPFPDDSMLSQHGMRGYYGETTHKFIPVLQNIRDALMRRRARHYLSLIPGSRRPLRVLDVGCAEGRLLNAFFEMGCRCWGVEHPSYPSERFVKRDQIVYRKGDLNSLNLPERFFDLIFLWHVLEHLDDPRSVISHLEKRLMPEGLLVLAVPNFSSLESKRFRQSWFHLDVPWHKYHFDASSLGYLAKAHGLRVSDRGTLCLEQGPFGLFQSLLNAMGWPHNELYELLKGRRNPGRVLPLTVQLLFGFGLIFPVFFATCLTSLQGKGAVMRFVLTKE